MLEFDAREQAIRRLAALDACSFVARPGRLTGFLGPNGAGKTTAMRTVFGLVELDSGAVRWQGAPIGPEQRARFGYMPEERGLVSAHAGPRPARLPRPALRPYERGGEPDR